MNPEFLKFWTLKKIISGTLRNLEVLGNGNFKNSIRNFKNFENFGNGNLKIKTRNFENFGNFGYENFKKLNLEL